MKPGTIHLQVPAATKGRWIRLSRAAGMRLTDWIVNAVEAQIMERLATIKIPDTLDFSDLKLARDSDGAVSFDLDVIELICEESDLPLEAFTESAEDNVSALIVGWYRSHIQRGGAPDPVAEDLIAEVTAEDKAGQSVSHQPGQA